MATAHFAHDTHIAHGITHLSLTQMLERAVNWVLELQSRYQQRRALLDMSDAMLKDTGLSRSDVIREADRIF